MYSIVAVKTLVANSRGSEFKFYRVKKHFSAKVNLKNNSIQNYGKLYEKMRLHSQKLFSVQGTTLLKIMLTMFLVLYLYKSFQKKCIQFFYINWKLRLYLLAIV